jgi:predicted acetyltransferase
MPESDDIELRSPKAEELTEYFHATGTAFGEILVEDEIERERPLIEYDRFVGARIRDEWVGTAGAYGLRLTVPGGEVGVSAITAVGVRPDVRRQGLLRRMMDWLIDDARRRGEPVAVLTASEAAIYHRFGFGQASTASSFSIDVQRAAFREPVDLGPGARFRMVDTVEATDIFSRIYEQVRGSIPGALTREPDRWRLWLVGDAEWMRQRDGIKFNVVLEVDGEPRGYAIYRIAQSWEMTGPNSTLNVQEVTGLDPAAEQALWQWLFSIDLVTKVAGRRGPSPHPLQHWLVEPRRLALTINDGLWLRILDVPMALAARRYLGSGSLVLDIADDAIDSNAGRWRLTVDNGRGSASSTKATPDLELDITAFAAAYLGGFRFVDLAVAGRVRGCHPGALETADALFTPPRAPWNSTPF